MSATILSLCSLAVAVIGVAASILTSVRKSAAAEGRMAAKAESLVSGAEFERSMGDLRASLASLEDLRTRVSQFEQRNCTATRHAAIDRAIDRATASLREDLFDLRSQVRTDLSEIYNRLTVLREATTEADRLDWDKTTAKLAQIDLAVQQLSDGVAGLVDSRHAAEAAIATLTSEVHQMRFRMQAAEHADEKAGQALEAHRERITRLEG